MTEKWGQFGYKDKESFDNSALLNEQRLYAKKAFGDQILHESKSELGMWLKNMLPDVSYTNVFRSEDTHFRIAKSDSYYPNISIYLNYKSENPQDSSIEIQAFDADKKEIASDTFVLQEKDLNGVKNFISENKFLWN